MRSACEYLVFISVLSSHWDDRHADRPVPQIVMNGDSDDDDIRICGTDSEDDQPLIQAVEHYIRKTSFLQMSMVV